MEEKWKWVVGYEGYYQISSFGRLKSFWRKTDGEILSVKHSGGWYLSAQLRMPGKRSKTKRIHTMVAEAFIGEIPKGYHVHHKDGDRQNNHVDNLEILHPARHLAVETELHPDRVSAMRAYNKYEKTREIKMFDIDGNYLASFPNAVAAEMVTGVCARNIMQVANREEYKPGKVRKQAGGFLWKFAEEEVMPI